MSARAYYNEIDPYAAQWLRNLIEAGHIAPGDVDERSIVDIRPSDLAGYVQCHFFAGIGGWSYAARSAGWPDDRPLWTGSCPCQPFSVAGKQAGQADERHLWPIFFGLISSSRPDVVMGEQVAAAVGKDWLDGVCSDLEGVGYACGAAVVPACAVDAPHRRDRLWFVADANQPDESEGREQRSRQFCRPCRDPRDSIDHVAHPVGSGRGQIGLPHSGHLASDGDRQGNRACDGSAPLGDANHEGRQELRQSGMGSEARGGEQARISPARAGSRSHWRASQITAGRRIEPGIRLLAHGVPARVGKLRAYGNAIVPQVAAEIIGAYLDCEDRRAA